MRQVEPRFRFPFAVQCALATGVFSVFFLAQSFAYLLYLDPRSEWLWFLSLRLNREAGPILELFDAAFPLSPLASCATLAGTCLIPLAFYLRRSWLGMSASGHIALFVTILPMSYAMHNAGGPTASYASLSDVAALATHSAITGFWVFAACALVPLCVLNHVAFFLGRRRQASH
jgi:hypothetical protein